MVNVQMVDKNITAKIVSAIEHLDQTIIIQKNEKKKFFERTKNARVFVEYEEFMESQ